MVRVLLSGLWRMPKPCPYCHSSSTLSNARTSAVRSGRFYRKSDGQWVQRYRCIECKKHFSSATFNSCYRQNKRQMNEPLRRLLCSGVSQRRAAIILRLNRTTIVRKFLFLSRISAELLMTSNLNKQKARVIEFDDLETFEHTKCKPLSVTLAVESGSRRILGFKVAKMPAKGPLAHVARKKYPKRADERRRERRKLFSELAHLVEPDALFKSDENPHYPDDVKRAFPQSHHKTYKGRRGCIVGQGELKKIGFDPIFSLNHTCAMLRANINRLIRKTWCTTKKPERLACHIALYSIFHNLELLKK